ncbi:aldehyde dehydrogenase family protein [Methanolapillus millepedarum]|uniref:Phenylacetaldehyde dehydrogenase n=1 Tax=Methanolapillus millepedarum TaxID=3028296 RepID=A0AA96ZUZ8_9EURY|nr:Phenylacetaldehyde dehydrogenase [Methanosarcinaceae archaeon Ac7]
MFISGKIGEWPGLKKADVKNPATGELVGTVTLADEKVLGDALLSCEAAFGSWSKTDPKDRGLILGKVSAALKNEHTVNELAVLLTKEQGKPLKEARREIEGVAEVIDYFTGLSSLLLSSDSDFYKNSNGYAFVSKKPLGVCAAILPWNLPALIFSWKVVPAILSGNTVVVKPSTTCPLTVLKMAELFYESGLPAGVLNVVPANGELAGDVFAKFPAVKKISFTGSGDAGKLLREKVFSARNPVQKRLTLELGGSDAMIICDDVDVKMVATEAVRSRFFNCGQACVSPKRIFVFESVFEDFKKSVLAEVSKIKVGDGMNPETTMGPICDKTQWEKIVETMQNVRLEIEKNGVGEILTGGNVPNAGVLNGADLSNGHFFEPTVVSLVPPSGGKKSVLLREEIFGPVMVLVPVKDLNDAVARSNDTLYGLGASVWTNDIRRAKTAVEQLEAGIVWVNQHARVLPSLPFGGVKESGVGRENGEQVLDDYLETKTVVLKNIF